MYFRSPHAKCRLLLHVRPNYSHSTSNDIDTDGARARARAKTGGYKGIRGDTRFKGRGGYPMETSYHFIRKFADSAYFVSLT